MLSYVRYACSLLLRIEFQKYKYNVSSITHYTLSCYNICYRDDLMVNQGFLHTRIIELEEEKKTQNKR